MITKTTFKDGHIPGNAVLTPQNAVDIRSLYAAGKTINEISVIYGISTVHVHDIVKRKKWKNAEQQVNA
jgi:uncharacterized protein YjcR